MKFSIQSSPENLARLDNSGVFSEVRHYARNRRATRPFTRTVLKLIEKYDVSTSLDLGCGLGVDVSILREIGIEAYGVDGHSFGSQRDGLVCHEEFFRTADLRRNLKVPNGVDLVFCREVAEHLHIAFSETLVRNIVRNGRVCYFTAAPPGQVGKGHVNCQLSEFWVALFSKYGWSVDDELTRFNSRHHTNGLDRMNGMVLSGERRPMLSMKV